MPGQRTRARRTGLESSGSHFKIHLCSTGNDVADGNLLSSVLGIAEPLWDSMTAGMGEPRADCYTPAGGSQICPGGDGKIDVYVLETNQCWHSPPPVTRCWSVEGAPGSSSNAAVAVPALPKVNNATSGFMLLAKARATDSAKIKTDFAHEFFHILQFAHNEAAMAADTGVRVHGRTIFRRSWFVEASATWAEWEYVPATSPEEVHWRFTSDFQLSRESLVTDTPPAHMYASYIWPFFAEQEKGPSSTFQAWVAAEGATDPDGITDAVEQQLSFQTHFRDFAVRNWNVDLPGHPIAVLYKDLKATDGSSPPFPQLSSPIGSTLKLAVTSGTPVKMSTVNLSLAAQYDEITFEPDVRKVILKFDKLPGPIDVDLLVEINGETWTHEQIDKGQPLVYCRDHEEENVSRIIVITSNHDKTRNGFLSGDYELEGRPACCAELVGVTAWKGRVSASYSFSGTQINNADSSDFDINQSFEVSGDLPLFLAPGDFRAAVVTGSGSEHDEIVPHLATPTFPTTQDGDGGLTQDSGLALSIDLQKCTFTFVAQATIEVLRSFYPTPFVDLVGNAWALGPHSLTAFTDRLSGTASFPAHSLDWKLTHLDGPDGYIVGGLGAEWFFVPGPEVSPGSAQITWDFQPDPPILSPTAAATEPPRR